VLGLNFYYAISDHQNEAEAVDWVQIVAVFLSLLPMVSIRFAVTENNPGAEADQPMHSFGGEKVFWTVIRHRQGQRWFDTAMERLNQGKIRSGVYRLKRSNSSFEKIKDLSCQYTVLQYLAAAHLARDTRFNTALGIGRLKDSRKIAEHFGVSESQEQELQQRIFLCQRIVDFRVQAFGDSDLRTSMAREDLADAYQEVEQWKQSASLYERLLGLNGRAIRNPSPQGSEDCDHQDL
jgi:hypothetical protein